MMRPRGSRPDRPGGLSHNGFAMLFVFVMAAAAAIMLYMELPRVAFEGQRHQEGLLIERGEQYRRAIQLYVRKFNRYPASLDDLEKSNNIRFLRRRYKDPLTGKNEWRLIHIDGMGVFTDSLINKPAQEKEQRAANTFITEGPAFGSDPAAAQGPLSAGLMRRASDRPAVVVGENPGQEQPPPQEGFQQPLIPGFPGQPPGQPNPGSGPPYPMPYPQMPYPQPGMTQPGQPSPFPFPQPGQPQTSFPFPQTQPGQPVPFPQYNPPLALNPQGQPTFPYPYNQPNPAYPQSAPPFGSMASFPPGLVAGRPTVPFPQSPTGSVSSQGGGFFPMPAPLGTGLPPPPGQGQNQALDLIRQILTTPRPGGMPGAQAVSAQTVGGGIAGVASKVEMEGIKVYNERSKYNEWEFLYDLKQDRRVGAGMMGQPSGTRGAQGGVGGPQSAPSNPFSFPPSGQNPPAMGSPGPSRIR